MIAVMIILPAGCGRANQTEDKDITGNEVNEGSNPTTEEEVVTEDEQEVSTEASQEEVPLPEVITPKIISAEEMHKKVLKRLKQDTVKTVYTRKYQDAANKVIEQLFQKSEYTLKQPLLILNPYGTLENGLYLRYASTQPCEVGYRIYVDHEAIDEYGAKLISLEETESLGTNQEGLITGLIPGFKNYLTLEEYDASGNVIAQQQFLVNLEKMKVSYPVLIPEEKVANEDLSEGVFWMFTGADSSNKTIWAMDNQGVSRLGLTTDQSVNYSMAKADHLLAYPKDSKTIVMINGHGQAEKIYRLGDYRYESGLCYQKNSNSLYLMASDVGRKSRSDLILKIDIETGEITVVIDFASFGKTENETIEVDSFGVYGDKLLVNSQEESSIYCINISEDEAKLEYVIADAGMWEDTGFNDICYEPIGSFEPFVHQHGIQINVNDDQLLNGQYYITMLSGTGDDENYYEIFVDENTQTFTLANRIPFVAEMTGVSAQSYGEREVILIQEDKQSLLATDQQLQDIIQEELTVQVVAEYDYSGQKIGHVILPANINSLIGVKKMKLSGVLYQ